jgi:hypothetical protein
MLIDDDNHNRAGVIFLLKKLSKAMEKMFYASRPDPTVLMGDPAGLGMARHRGFDGVAVYR